ncbi:MAG: hypothetical protein LRY57_03255 [Alphaproteobacteria bacterium]|nr:hypothetical protein [Alphaproteobacteria bacterium]
MAVWQIRKSGRTRPAHHHKTLEDLGFVGPVVPAGIQNGKAYTYSDIRFDPDLFGSIKEVRITPPGRFDMNGKRLKRIEIDNLSLSGTLEDDGRISLSGLMKESNKLESSAGFLHLLNLADVVVLNKARLDVLSSDLGGIRLETNLELRRDNKVIRLTGDIRSVQKQLSLEGKVSGNISPDNGRWELALDVEQGKSDIDGIFLSRIYGEISLAGQGWNIGSLYGQTTAGNMTFHGYSLQAPSFNMELRNGVFKALAEAKHGTEGEGSESGLEFGFLYTSANSKKIQISIFSPTIELLMGYLDLPDDIDLAPVKDYKNFNFIMETPLHAAAGEEIKIPFIIKTQNNTSEQSGFAALDVKKPEEKTEISSIFWSDKK